MEKIGLVFGSDTGMTVGVIEVLVENWSASELEEIDANIVKNSDFERFDKLILALPTWYDGELQSDWDDYYSDFENVDFTGKTVALLGLGDQHGYSEYFIDGVGTLAKVVLKNGGKIIGKWPVAEYEFEESKAVVEDDSDYFYGLALDEDNEPEKTEERLLKWLKQIEKEFEL